MNPDLLKTIQTLLEDPCKNLTALFCETLLWGRATGAAFQKQVTVAAGQNVSLTFQPVAQISGLPVFHVDWPFAKAPTVLQRRAVYQSLSATYVEHLLVYITSDCRQAAFVWARRRSSRVQEEAGKARVEMRTLPYAVGSPARTTVDQLGKLAFSMEELGLFGDPGRTAVTDKLDAAFDVEKVTRKFFEKYREIFEAAEASITLDWSREQKRLYTQRFFNRIMFLAFLEKKGWLRFEGGLDTAGRSPAYSTSGGTDYLRALLADYVRNDPEKRREANFHRKRLNTLFFLGLNNPRDRRLVQDDPQYKLLRDQIGEVPYLNGGLFEQEQDDEQWFFPDAIVASILTELVYHFNFTVTESTPLDVEVAVDPEMLGKIFEELVTGRHETGSYYTPKPVVAFMCREALKGYLETALPREGAEAIARFVDGNEGGALRDPETALGALKRVKVCDPACGSGAYLLGMLHELLEQRACLFAVRQLDPKTVYERKLEIIQTSLYGVDLDPFAVSIARLRLWLSLIVDFEGETPPPLPNLTYKIEAGDSLTAPDPSGGLQPDLFRYNQVQDYLRLKNEFMNAHEGSEKKKALEKEIDAQKTAIKAWAHPAGEEGFDWAVEFAEVFMPEMASATLTGAMAGMVNAGGGQMELTQPGREGGFDIVLANPPYVRQELLGDYKNLLKPIYSEVYNGMADLYVYFYARAHQLLKNGGVSCFISSNKWLRSGYGEKLRQHLLDAQAFKLVVDFGELPVFQTAATFPAIFLWQKQPRRNTPTKWSAVKNLQDCYNEGIYEHITRISENLPSTQFGKDKPRLVSMVSAGLQGKMESKGQRLGELLKGEINFGIKTGLNLAFHIDQATFDKIVKDDPKSKEILKPMLRGDDVRHFETHYRNNYLVWTFIGVEIDKYPAVFRHVQQYEKEAKKRLDQGKHWWELRACDYYDKFEKPKIVYPIIGKEPRFVLEEGKYFLNDV